MPTFVPTVARPVVPHTLTPLERSLMFRRRPAALAGFGGTDMTMMGASFMALRAPGTLAPIAGGLLLGIVGRIVLGPGKLRMGVGVASLGVVTFGAWRLYQTAAEIQQEMKTVGAAAVGERVSKGATEDAKDVIAEGGSAGGAHDVPMTGVLKHFSCYENAKRDYEQKEGWLNKRLGGTWFGNLVGIQPPARNPMKDCALTEPQLAIIKRAFGMISRTDRARLDTTFAPGGALQDLGPAA